MYNTIQMIYLAGSLATSSGTVDLKNPIDDCFLSAIEKPQIEWPSACEAFKYPYYTIPWARTTLDGFEYYDFLSVVEMRKDNLHRLFETYLSAGEVEKAREVLTVAVKEFPAEKKFSMAKNIIAPPKFISSNKSETEGIHDTVQFLRNMRKGFEKKWIAVSKGELLRVSESYRELAEMYKGTGVIVVKVL